MGVTFVSGEARQRRQVFGAVARREDRVLAATALVAALAMVLACLGRMAAFQWPAPDAPAGVVNLNEVTDPAALDGPLTAAFAHAADRQFAARAIADYVGTGGPRRVLPNVGALLQIRVAAEGVDRDTRLVVFAERLRSARESAAAAARPAPVDLALLTSGDLSAIKPALSVRTLDDFRSAVFWYGLALLGAFGAAAVVSRWRQWPGDRLLLAAAWLLTTIGFVLILSRPDPVRDTLLLARYTQGVVLGVAVFAAVSWLPLRAASFLQLSYLPLIAALALSVVLVLFGDGPGRSSAKVNLGPVQPIEAIRFLLALFLAGYFARRWESIRQVDGEGLRMPGGARLRTPRGEHVLPVLGGVGLALLLFFVQRDLGPALLLSIVFLAMVAMARGGVGIALVGTGVLTLGFYLGHWLRISDTLVSRMGMWQSPWDNLVRGGDQIAQAFWAMATGAATGTGLGLGQSRFVPEGHTDLVFAAAGEEIGVIGVLGIAALYALIASRGLQIARRASTDYGFFLAAGMTLFLVAPAIVMGAGVLGLLPLTGVVTPFLSYGGSAMVANFAALGVLAAVGADRQPAADLRAFAPSLRWLGRSLAAAAVVLIVVALRAHVVAADATLVRPQLGVQADGGRRFQYNPRVLEAIAAIPRGTIVDRRGLPLAADLTPALQKRAPELARLGIDLDAHCRTPGGRCYPLGGAAFHLVGDIGTRRNWTATNTSYVERDAEARLRGFDDRASTVATVDGDGRGVLALRRDYGDLVPLVRHRFQPTREDVRAITDQPRDVRLTIDARLQWATANVLAKTVRSSGVTSAAAVVLDAASGEILAAASYPWPGVTPVLELARGGSGSAADEGFDRARYGLYPPGSTFKIVTAAAALRLDPAAARTAFTCERLPDGRSGARIAGWGRPVRDDRRDPRPHGRISLRDGVVQSCNAYFAQLAVAVGTEALRTTAGDAGIRLTPTASPERLRDTLPHAGYGQGDVVATPLRMARIAAAIASDGRLREPPLVRGGGETVVTPFVSPAAARQLAGMLRDAVTTGTGRALKSHSVAIAGKTGTAEVDEAASHAWFVGFAPAGAADGRIAFAVIVEHAGYGGGAAAAVAGQIVTAAAAAGWGR